MNSAAPKPRLVVRPVRQEERGAWRGLMQQHHYLGFEHPIGESLCYLASRGEQWVALLGWGSAALKCGVRDRWIGWERALQWRRLPLLANNVRFLMLPGGREPNLASRILALNLRRLSRDWEFYHGHPILLAETFVDGARFRGTCYRAAGWQLLGQTRGFAKRNRHYWHHGQPKLVFVRPLAADAVARLLAPFPPPHTSTQESLMINVNALPLQGEGGLIDLLSTIVDPRKPRGVRHPVATIVGIAVCAAVGSAEFLCHGRMGAGTHPRGARAVRRETLDPAFGADDSPRLARARCQSAGCAPRPLGGAAAVAARGGGGGRW
jgi:hypothetical protein